MNPILSTLRSFLGAIVGHPTPATGADPATPTTTEPLTTATVASVRALLDEHDRGIFLRSALLADLLRRDADVFGALQQRLIKFQSHATTIVPADDSAPALEAAADLEAEWPLILPDPVQSDLYLDGVMLGFAWGQAVWQRDDARGHLVQRVDSWPGSSVEYQRTERQWYAQTVDRGRIPITPGDGQWLLFAPRSRRAPWLWGAVRPVAEWSLRSGFAANDASKRSEVFGNGIWKASMPLNARETNDGKAFARNIRAIGRNAVIPTPKGTDPGQSYDVELIEAKTDAFRIFEFLMGASGGRIRLAILCQDLTSQNQQVGTNASSKTGEGVMDDLIEADARGWSEMATQQVSAPRSKYLGVPLSRVHVDAEPEVDRKADADAQAAAADAAQKWLALVPDTDVGALADAARIPRKAKAPAP